MIKIIGDPTFCQNTEKALELLKTRDIEAFNEVNACIGSIKQNKISGIDVLRKPPRFLVSNELSNSDTHWYASCILHDAMHSFLYFDALKKGQNGLEVFQGHDAEMFCLDKQIETLKNIGASKELLKYAESLHDSKWYEVPVSKRNW